MEYAYTSLLAAHITGLIAEKRAGGCLYRDAAYMLKVFDTFMEDSFPNEHTITRDAACSWSKKKDSEGHNNLLNRVSQVRQLALFMCRTGTPAFVPDAKGLASRVKPEHYIFAPEGLTAFFDAADAYDFGALAPWRSLVAPAVLKTVYCLGLRPMEALRLRAGDVDLKAGTVSIYHSKGDKDRTVFLAEDLREMLEGYDRAVRRMLPVREAFFPNGRGTFYATGTLRGWFIDIWSTLPLSEASFAKIPSLMSFRHTYATNRIRLWASEGRELRSVIYYLVEHMGHKSISETEYYLHFVPLHFAEMLAKVGPLSGPLYPEVM